MSAVTPSKFGLQSGRFKSWQPREPMGAEVLRWLHATTAEQLHRLDDLLNKVDDDPTRHLLEEIIRDRISNLDNIEETWRFHRRYGDFPPLYGMGDGYDEDDPDLDGLDDDLDDETPEAGETGTKAVPYHQVSAGLKPVAGSIVTPREALNHYDASTGKWTFEARPGEKLEIVQFEPDGTGVRVRNRQGQEMVVGMYKLRMTRHLHGHKLPNPTGQEEPYHRETSGTCKQGERADLTGCQPAGKSLDDTEHPTLANQQQAIATHAEWHKHLRDATDFLMGMIVDDHAEEKQGNDELVHPLASRQRKCFDFQQRLDARHLVTILGELARETEDQAAKTALEQAVRLLRVIIEQRDYQESDEPLTPQERADLGEAAKSLQGLLANEKQYPGWHKEMDEETAVEPGTMGEKSLDTDALLAAAQQQNADIARLQESLQTLLARL